MLRRGQRQWRAHNLSRFLSFWDATISTTLKYWKFWQCLTWTKLLFRNFWQVVSEFMNFFSFERKPGRTPSPFRYAFKMRIIFRKWHAQQYLSHAFEKRRVWDFWKWDILWIRRKVLKTQQRLWSTRALCTLKRFDRDSTLEHERILHKFEEYAISFRSLSLIKATVWTFFRM